MARKQRVEVEGGLYHLISRGNDRQDIFHSTEDHQKFISLLTKQKERAGFFLYAFCLMTNHIHLLIERQAEPIGRTMQRLLTGYSQYYNRRYRRVEHVFQGRHKAILCESQEYLGKLVRYIHLNPVRAGMVDAAEEYLYSSHRAYIGLEPAGIVDVDPVLRQFGSRREIAQQHFIDYVGAGCGDDAAELSSAENDILGSAEFVDASIHRVGEIPRRLWPSVKKDVPAFDADKLLSAVESVFGLSRDVFCGAGKSTRTIMAKEVLILAGREAGANITELSGITGLDSSSVSRRYDAASKNAETDTKLAYAREMVEKKYFERIAGLTPIFSQLRLRHQHQHQHRRPLRHRHRRQPRPQLQTSVGSKRLFTTVTATETSTLQIQQP